MKSNKLDRISQAALARNPRATQSAWLKYEPVILAAFRQHPKPYIYRPTNMAATTVASRIRDAIRGKIAFDYASEISATDLATFYESVIVKVDNDGAVFIGPMERINETLTSEATNASRQNNMIFPDLSFEEVAAFTLLLSSQRLTGPVVIKNPPDLSLLPSRPNVETLSRPDGSLVLL